MLEDQGNPLDLLAAASDPLSAIGRRPYEEEETIYPLPSATYEEVAVDASLFMQTLRKLHKSMGTKFMVPIMGGKTLDLYQLFLEVTRRGGLEKVHRNESYTNNLRQDGCAFFIASGICYANQHQLWVCENIQLLLKNHASVHYTLLDIALTFVTLKDKRWKEVITIFNFPSTITNASFVLRRYYISLLHHYEQVYFFRAQGCPVVSAAQNLASLFGVSPVEHTKLKRNKTSKADSVKPGSCIVKGVVDGKFEYGYLVTVTIGSETLKGVLYHAPLDPHAAQAMQSNGASTSHTKVHQEKKKHKRPKRKRSGYNFFFEEQYARLKPSFSTDDSAISKQIELLWSNLTLDEKAVYQERGLLDNEMVEC